MCCPALDCGSVPSALLLPRKSPSVAWWWQVQRHEAVGPWPTEVRLQCPCSRELQWLPCGPAQSKMTVMEARPANPLVERFWKQEAVTLKGFWVRARIADALKTVGNLEAPFNFPAKFRVRQLTVMRLRLRVGINSCCRGGMARDKAIGKIRQRLLSASDCVLFDERCHDLLALRCGRHVRRIHRPLPGCV
jgi:hypothetical protein